MIFESGSRPGTIPNGAFQCCGRLQSLCIPASVEVLCEDCFHDMPGLSSLTFEPGSKLRIMENQVFGNCPSLKSIVLPASVLVVDGSPFMHSCFEEIVVEAGNTTCFSSIDSLISLNRTTLFRHFGLAENVLISREYETLASFSFSGCPVMSTVSLEDGSKLTRIEAGAFFQCGALISICIPAGVDIVGKICFRDCWSLSQVTFESGCKLSEIGRESFKKCASLKSICIPSEVKCIPEYCFSECRSLKTVSFEPGSKLTRIADYAFNDCSSIWSFEIPSQVEILTSNVFRNCSPSVLLSFELPSHLRQLELPKDRDSSLCIPDSVEILTGVIPCSEISCGHLQFGRESRLVEIELERPTGKYDCSRDGKCRYRTFVSLSEATLRRFQLKLEVV
jgi:hypothetical protein